MRSGIAACVTCLVFLASCQTSDPKYHVVKSEFVEFRDLFTPVDTIQFDASVLIGGVGFIDLSDWGEFLVTDFSIRVIYIFSNTGRHLRTIEMSHCNPEDEGQILSAKFLSNGEIIAASALGMYRLNADGSCGQRLLKISPGYLSFCERQDTVFFLIKSTMRPIIQAYSIDSGDVHQFELRKPRLPKSTRLKSGVDGRQIACFDQGVFYRYAESSDGEPMRPGANTVIHQPKSYRSPEKDYTSQGINNILSELRELQREYTYSQGLFELDMKHRMVTFQYPTEVNVNIVHMDTETSVSTRIDPSKFIASSKNGYIYLLGDYEQLASGEVGNRILEVWQFHPFASHSKISDE